MQKNKGKLKPDAVLKEYWRKNNRFADLFNQVFFHGKPVLAPENLQDSDTEESAIILEQERVLSISRARDLIKQYQNGVEFVLIGLENQMRIHYGMPVRTMLYEALNYTKQCKAIEQEHRREKDLKGEDEFLSGLTSTDRLYPVVTLIIYYGEKSWDGPESLNDMMNLPKEFQELFNNYQTHVLQVKNTEIYQFQDPDNQDFFQLIQEFYKNGGAFDFEKFKQAYPDWMVYWETLAAVGVATGTMELLDYAIEHQGGTITMCSALQKLKQEGIQQGLQEGIQQGLQEGIQQGEIRGTIRTFRKLGYPDEIIRSNLEETYCLTEEEITKYLKSIS